MNISTQYKLGYGLGLAVGVSVLASTYVDAKRGNYELADKLVKVAAPVLLVSSGIVIAAHVRLIKHGITKLKS